MKITNPYGPNTTVLLPGDCNAHCDFCFWNRDEANIPFDHTFSEKALKQLKRLPTEFSVLSVSGGEPTLSPEFTRFSLMLIKNRTALRLTRTVLTTHGGNLLRNLDVALAAYDHINISRHRIGYEANVEVFKTDKIPTDAALKALIKKIHKVSKVDVTLNCVVPANVTKEFCDEFVSYAKDLGADAVSFRKVASTAKRTKAEIAYAEKYKYISKTKCPVCRGAVMRDDDGFEIRWKGSVMEPSLQTGGVYEAVMHPDAKVYTDWGRTTPFPFPKPKVPRIAVEPEPFPGTSGGCGSGGRGGCGSGVNSGCGSGGCGSR